MEVLDLVQKLLKWVSMLNQRSAPASQTDVLAPGDGNIGPVHYAVVESDHPYKPATVSVSKVSIPPWWSSLKLFVILLAVPLLSYLCLYFISFFLLLSFIWHFFVGLTGLFLFFQHLCLAVIGALV